MNQIIQQYKPRIEQRLEDLCNSTKKSSVPWADDVAKRLFDFCERGKMVRGSIILYTADIFGNSSNAGAIIDIAASVELLHAALLIHDDIIDHDKLRRGKESMHVQYEILGEKESAASPKDFGEGMAICVGDIAIFGAFSHLSQIKLPFDVHQQIMQLVTSEFLTVGFGEIEDIAMGYLPKIPSAEQVLSMYKKKTARYTFSLPFLIGCIVTKQLPDTKRNMELLGEYLGLIFQLRDDLLTISGEESVVGKTIGNDIVENKKTYTAVLLWDRVNAEETKELQKIFGNPNVSKENIQYVKTLLESYNVLDDVKKQIEQYKEQAKRILSLLPVPKPRKEELLGLLEYTATREK